ncbi:MAG: T9SS type A sorting domain-containing protein, partial [Bacteroidia bacterium]
GGFYFQSGYAYNLGVGFAALPHNYGRVWYPCFDNFVERASYEFNITTNGGKIDYSNGYLASDTTDGSGNRTRKWILTNQIPSYLASVSVANYTEIHQSYTGISGTIPIVIAALPADTINVKAAFVNLNLALSTWENHFGPYRWNRVGYCMVPFSSGAMEHATNISYPLVVTGAAYGTTYQNIMAHELSHHWFGDLATCRTAQEMWLNEGWAHYCEFLFYEALNGHNSYLSYVRANHLSDLQFLQYKEGGFQSLSNVPLAYTYGDHVYNKGADVAHTLRGYFGNDSLFYYSLKTYLANNQYKDVSCADFRDGLTAASGMNLTNFFNDWVFNPGWPHFSIDSSVVVPSGSNYSVTVYVKQKLTGALAYFTNVPLELTFKAANFVEQTQTIMMSGANASFNFTVPFNPAFVAINMGEKISHAVAPEYHTIKTTGAVNFANAKMNLTVSALSDSAFVRVEHNYTAPDPFKTYFMPYRLSPDHYWKVDGILPATFKASATVTYEGRTTSFSGNYYQDNNLINTTEDSLVLMYRRNAADDWHVYPYYSKNYVGTHTDKHGVITIDTLQLGEYVYAMMDPALGVKNDPASAQLPSLKVFPNPAKDIITVDIYGSFGKIPVNSVLVVTDISGKTIFNEKLQQQNTININTSAFTSGVYFISIKSKDELVGKSKFVVAH